MSWKDSFPRRDVYFETKNGILYCANAFELLREFPQKYFDLILTDPLIIFRGRIKL